MECFYVAGLTCECGEENTDGNYCDCCPILVDWEDMTW